MSLEETESFAGLGDDFECGAVQALILDPLWAEQMLEIIKVEYFSLDHLAYIVSKYYKYYNNYKAFPSISILATVLRESLSSSNDDVLARKIVAFLKKTKKDPGLTDIPYIKEKALDFCKKAAMREALSSCIDLAAADNYSPIIEIMKKALMAGEESSAGHDFEEDAEARYRDETRDPCPTGISFVDSKEVLRGGLDRGRLGIFVSPPGVGKSHWLVQVGGSAMLEGKNVVHYTMEMDEEEVARRYDAFFTGIDSKEIIERHQEVRDFYIKLKEKGIKLGRLIVKEYPSKFPTANTFRAHLQKIEMTKKFKPDLIVVDYADEMSAIEKFEGDSRHQYKAIYRDLRNLCRELNPRVPLWSASQSNKEGSNAEVVTGANMSESYRKLDVPDVVITGATKSQDKAKGIMMGFIEKHRGGNDGMIFPMHVDKSTSRFQVISREEYDTLSKTDEEHEQDQRAKLRAKLKGNLNNSKKDIGANRLHKEDSSKTTI